MGQLSLRELGQRSGSARGQTIVGVAVQVFGSTPLRRCRSPRPDGRLMILVRQRMEWEGEHQPQHGAAESERARAVQPQRAGPDDGEGDRVGRWKCAAVLASISEAGEAADEPWPVAATQEDVRQTQHAQDGEVRGSLAEGTHFGSARPWRGWPR